MKNKNHNCPRCHNPLKYRGNHIFICKNKNCEEHGHLIQYELNIMPCKTKNIPDVWIDPEGFKRGLFFRGGL